jgi:hypothetical protein
LPHEPVVGFDELEVRGILGGFESFDVILEAFVVDDGALVCLFIQRGDETNDHGHRLRNVAKGFNASLSHCPGSIDFSIPGQ